MVCCRGLRHLACLFLALSILIGLFGMNMMKMKIPSQKVIKIHCIVSVVALVLVLVHMFTILFDKFYWGDIIGFYNLFIPDFSTKTLFYVSLGIFGLYAMIEGTITGVLFKRMVKKFGYFVWIMPHRIVIAAAVFAFFHALELETDVKGNYLVIGGFGLLLAIIVLKIALIRIHDIRMKRSAKKASAKQPQPQKKETPPKREEEKENAACAGQTFHITSINASHAEKPYATIEQEVIMTGGYTA